MISFVVWKWRGPDPTRQFLSQHVNVLRASIARNFRRRHRFICITDDATGLDGDIEALALPSSRLDHLPAPVAGTATRRFPSCYRRLWNFSPEAADVLGERIVALDIDVVVCGNLEAMLPMPGDFVGWCDPRFGWRKIAGGIYSLVTGSHPEVWERFDPESSPAIARAAGLHGSDQAWISYLLFPPAWHWGKDDGIVKLGWLPQRCVSPPPGVRLVFTAGHSPPWHPKVQERHPWIRSHWRQ